MQTQPLNIEKIASFGSTVHRAISAMMLAGGITACSAPDRLVAPDAVAVSSAGSRAALADFIAAQGTYCNDAIGLSCAENEFYGLGYIYNFCGADCATGISADFGGVNRKWWDVRSLGAYPAPYSSTGTLNETVQQDGRRRIVVNIRAQNTFVSFFDASLTTLVGADFFEYPSPFGNAASRPLTGETTVHADLVLPLGYVGYPDIVEALADANSGIEIRSLNMTASVDGPLRVAYDGIPAGTMVRVRGVSRALLKLRDRGVPSRHLIAQGYDPAARISVHVLR